MNRIDAVEGTAKNILSALFDLYISQRQDDSEYILTVRSLIDATVSFVDRNREISDQPSILREVLYDYGKQLWLIRQQSQDPEIDSTHFPESKEERSEYLLYYYDYIYEKGEYPP
jgi:hypothetical protein